ncbi:Bug family tripartite tricarboxylate transporter substrate binding protein [Rhizobium terrae]|uniref:Bug family tripartite tricarboxylate transporter substrate binding protein n=1 Tax=Rhizobium terrae TaxID=2171756 RepID=UPI000E3BB65A|nr:tripartite tricarboxylate transporter substrate binding protein [Rhizobium terrae]
MGIIRRTLLLAAISAYAACLAGRATAQEFPSRPITVVVPSGAGGLSDTLARLVVNKAKTYLDATYIVENKPGASGIIAASAVQRADPDGYTLLLANGTSNGAAEALAKNPSYDSAKDFIPVAFVGETQLALVASKSLPVANGPELLEYARKNPGKLSYGTFGQGSAGHLFAEVMAKNNGVQMVHVPFKNEADVAQAIIGGEIELGMLVSSKTFVDQGQVKLIGVTSPSGTSAYPGWPSLSSQGVKGFSDARGFQMFLAPAGTPEAVVRKLGDALSRAAQDPEVAERIKVLGVAPANVEPAQLNNFYQQLVAQWRTLVKESGVQVN